MRRLEALAAHSSGSTPATSPVETQPGLPDWFVEAASLANGRFGSIVHKGCTIAYQAWGNASLPPILMLHGAGASSEWWEATAILLADRFHIVAPSFAGVGRSQWRETYSIEQCVGEALACARAESALRPGIRPICVAHSFGSEAGLRLAIDPDQPISQLILVDSLMGLYGSPDASFRIRERQYYSSSDYAVSRFSTVPRDDYGPEFLRARVAYQSLERFASPSEEEIWTWRADPNVMAKLSCEPVFDRIGDARCPIDFIYGGRSSMNSTGLRERQAEAVNYQAVFLGIQEAGHHIPLDRPRELAEAIRELVELRS